MTTKEIAKATGKDITTVQRWVKKMDSKMQSVDGKMQSSTSTNPADFDLTETIAIIETGMGKNAADLYRMSAKEVSVLPQNTEVAQLGAMVANLCLAVSEQMKMMQAQQVQISAILSKPKEIELVQDYYTIKGYANKISLSLTMSDAILIGRAAGKLSREKGVEIRKADDERFGVVNSYSVEVLKEVFSI